MDVTVRGLSQLSALRRFTNTVISQSLTGPRRGRGHNKNNILSQGATAPCQIVLGQYKQCHRLYVKVCLSDTHNVIVCVKVCLSDTHSVIVCVRESLCLSDTHSVIV